MKPPSLLLALCHTSEIRAIAVLLRLSTALLESSLDFLGSRVAHIARRAKNSRSVSSCMAFAADLDPGVMANVQKPTTSLASRRKALLAGATATSARFYWIFDGSALPSPVEISLLVGRGAHWLHSAMGKSESVANAKKGG